MRAAVVCAIAVLVALAVPRSTRASTPGEDLARAREEFRAGRHEAAILVLNHLLYPDVRLADRDDLYEAHVLYGVSLFETGDNKGATREIEAALDIKPKDTIEAGVFSREAVRFFDEIKAAKDARDKAAADARAAAEERARIAEILRNMKVYESRPWWVNLVPFGAGQFQNGQNGKGIIFAATEAAAAGTSIAIFVYLTNKYGYGGQVPKEEAADARRLQQIAIAADVVFYGVAIVGIIDAFRNYKPRVEVDKSSLPADILVPETQKTKRKPKPKSSVLLHPIPLPDGAGIGLSWEH